MKKPAPRLRCPCCPAVNRLCFWGPRPPAVWKRPVLWACGALLALGFGALSLWQLVAAMKGASTGPGLILLAGALCALGLLGLWVAWRGCEACVARVFGEL